MEDLSDQVTGEELLADQFNKSVLEETQNFVSEAGLSFSTSDQKQMVKSAAIIASVSVAYVDSGAADAYVLTSKQPFTNPQVLTNGEIVLFIASASNTTNSTAIVNAIGSPLPIVLPNGSALVGGEIIGDTNTFLQYDTGSGGQFFLLNDTVGILMALSSQVDPTGASLIGATFTGKPETVQDTLNLITAATADITGATATLNWGHNIASVTRQSDGLYTILFTTDIGTDKYVVTALSNDPNTLIMGFDNRASTGIDIHVTLASNGNFADGDFTMKIEKTNQ